MKKFIPLFIVIVLSCLNVCSQPAVAETPSAKTDTTTAKITGSFEMNYLRHYLWRGMLFGNNDVAQPALELSYKNFTVALAQNFNYVPKNVPEDFYTRKAFFDEQDAEIRYSRSWGKFSCDFSAMAYFYFYQLQSPNTAELYNYTSYNFYKGLSLFTENSIDFVAYKGAVYSNNGILLEASFKKNIKIEWNAYLAFANEKFNSTYYNLSETALNLAGSHIDISKQWGKYFIKASAEKNVFPSAKIKQATALKGTGNFGIAAGISF